VVAFKLLVFEDNNNHTIIFFER